MGYRENERRDPYVRRLSEKIRENEIAGKRAADRVSDLNNDIARRRRSEEAKRFFEQMHEKKASALELISRCSSVHKDKWYEHLNSIDLTRHSADTELKNLLEEVERDRRLWIDFKLPEWMS